MMRFISLYHTTVYLYDTIKPLYYVTISLYDTTISLYDAISSLYHLIITLYDAIISLKISFHHSRMDRWLQSFGYFLRCEDNNKADTILSFFQNGVSEFRIPVGLRMRSDKGLDNY